MCAASAKSPPSSADVFDGTGMVYLSAEDESMTHLTERITVDPEQCGGHPCIRGMRIRVIDVLSLLANGLTPGQVLQELPDLEPEDIHACLRFAQQRLDHPVLTP